LRLSSIIPILLEILLGVRTEFTGYKWHSYLVKIKAQRFIYFLYLNLYLQFWISYQINLPNVNPYVSNITKSTSSLIGIGLAVIQIP